MFYVDTLGGASYIIREDFKCQKSNNLQQLQRGGRTEDHLHNLDSSTRSVSTSNFFNGKIF